MRPRRARPTSPPPWAAPAPLPPARAIGSRQHEARQQGRPRDLIGYGEHPPHPRWPGGTRVALQFVLNYEGGVERSILDCDPHAETFLFEMVGAQPFPARHMSRESLYEYGARAGVWRILTLFRDRELPLTVFGVAQALPPIPAVVEAVL